MAEGVKKIMGVSERRQREKENLRKRILDVSRKIVIAEGFDALTIRRVADAVEYAPGTLYLYFENRDAIARALCVEVFQAMHDALSPVAKIKDPGKRLRAFIRNYVAFALDRPEMYRLALMSDPKFSDVLLREGPIEGSDGPGQKTFVLMVKTIAELRRKEAGAFALAEMVWVAVHGLVSLKIVCHAYPVTPVDALADTLAETLLSGMLQNKQRIRNGRVHSVAI
jgi:AcrR family transcriptional regulator